MKSFFSRLHDTQTGHSKSASRETYKFWIPNNVDPESGSARPVVAPAPAPRPHGEKRSSSRAPQPPQSLPMPSYDRPSPSYHPTAGPSNTGYSTARPNPPQHTQTYPQPLPKATSTRHRDHDDSKAQPPPASSSRPIYSTRTYATQDTHLKSSRHGTSAPTGQHEVWLPTNAPSTSKQVEEQLKSQNPEGVERSERYRSRNEDPLMGGTRRDRERERPKERDKERVKERDGEREKSRKVREQEKAERERERQRIREKERERERELEREKELVKEAEREQQRRDREREREEAEREQQRKDREREREKEREKEREREREKEREKEREREREKEREREREKEQEREKEREKYREREREQRERERERERVRYYERERREREKERDREKHRIKEREKEKEERGKETEGEVIKASPNTKGKERAGQENMLPSDEVSKRDQALADANARDQDRRSRKEKESRDPSRLKERDRDPHKYRAEATDGEQDPRRSKPRTVDRDRRRGNNNQGWLSDNLTGHERKPSRQIPIQESVRLDDAYRIEGGGSSAKLLGAGQDRPLELTNPNLMISQPKVLSVNSDAQPPISATPRHMPHHLPSRELRTSERPLQQPINPGSSNDPEGPTRREINRLKLSARQDDPLQHHSEFLPKTIETTSSAHRPPLSRTYGTAHLLPSQEVVPQTPRIGSNILQTKYHQPTATFHTPDNLVSEPFRDPAHSQLRQDLSKERLPMEPSEPVPTKFDTSSLMKSISKQATVASSHIPNLTPTQIIPSMGYNTTSRVDSVSQSQKPEPSPKSHPNVNFLITNSVEPASLSPAVQSKDPPDKAIYSGPIRDTFSLLPSSLPATTDQRYTNHGREAFALPTKDIHIPIPSIPELDDTRPSSKAQPSTPFIHSQTIKGVPTSGYLTKDAHNPYVPEPVHIYSDARAQSIGPPIQPPLVKPVLGSSSQAHNELSIQRLPTASVYKESLRQYPSNTLPPAGPSIDIPESSIRAIQATGSSSHTYNGPAIQRPHTAAGHIDGSRQFNVASVGQSTDIPDALVKTVQASGPSSQAYTIPRPPTADGYKNSSRQPAAQFLPSATPITDGLESSIKPIYSLGSSSQAHNGISIQRPPTASGHQDSFRQHSLPSAGHNADVPGHYIKPVQVSSLSLQPLNGSSIQRPPTASGHQDSSRQHSLPSAGHSADVPEHYIKPVPVSSLSLLPHNESSIQRPPTASGHQDSSRQHSTGLGADVPGHYIKPVPVPSLTLQPFNGSSIQRPPTASGHQDSSRQHYLPSAGYSADAPGHSIKPVQVTNLSLQPLNGSSIQRPPTASGYQDSSRQHSLPTTGPSADVPGQYVKPVQVSSLSLQPPNGLSIQRPPTASGHQDSSRQHFLPSAGLSVEAPGHSVKPVQVSSLSLQPLNGLSIQRPPTASGYQDSSRQHSLPSTTMSADVPGQSIKPVQLSSLLQPLNGLSIQRPPTASGHQDTSRQHSLPSTGHSADVPGHYIKPVQVSSLSLQPHNGPSIQQPPTASGHKEASQQYTSNASPFVGLTTDIPEASSKPIQSSSLSLQTYSGPGYKEGSRQHTSNPGPSAGQSKDVPESLVKPNLVSALSSEAHNGLSIQRPPSASAYGSRQYNSSSQPPGGMSVVIPEPLSLSSHPESKVKPNELSIPQRVANSQSVSTGLAQNLSMTHSVPNPAENLSHTRLAFLDTQSNVPQSNSQERIDTTISRPSDRASVRQDIVKPIQYHGPSVTNPNMISDSLQASVMTQVASSGMSNRINIPSDATPRSNSNQYLEVKSQNLDPRNEESAALSEWNVDIGSQPQHVTSQLGAPNQKQGNMGLPIRQIETLVVSPPNTDVNARPLFAEKESPRNRASNVVPPTPRVPASSMLKQESPKATQQNFASTARGSKQDSPRITESRQKGSPSKVMAIPIIEDSPASHDIKREFTNKPVEQSITTHNAGTRSRLEGIQKLPKSSTNFTPQIKNSLLPAVSSKYDHLAHPSDFSPPAILPLLQPALAPSRTDVHNTISPSAENMRPHPSPRTRTSIMVPPSIPIIHPKPEEFLVRRMDDKPLQVEEEKKARLPLANNLLNSAMSKSVQPASDINDAPVGKDTPSLGFFTSTFSSAINTPTVKMGIVEPLSEPNVNQRTEAEPRGDKFFVVTRDGPKQMNLTAAKVGTPHVGLRNILDQKFSRVDENRADIFPSNIPPPSPLLVARKEVIEVKNDPPITVSRPKFSHPVLADILSSPPPAKASTINMKHSETMVQPPSISNAYRRVPSLSNINVNPELARPRFERDQTNVDVPKPLNTQKYVTDSDQKYAMEDVIELSKAQLPAKENRTPPLKTHGTQGPPSTVLPARPVHQSQETYVTPPFIPVPSSLVQPAVPIYPTFKQDSTLPADGIHPRNGGVRSGLDSTLVPPSYERKPNVLFTPVTAQPGLPESYLSQKAPLQLTDPRTLQNFPGPVAPSHHSNRHRYSTSLPTSSVPSYMVKPATKDDLLKSRSPAHHQPRFTPLPPNQVNSVAEKMAVSLPQASSEETILMTPSSLAPTVLKPTTSRQSVTPSVSSQTGKKGGILSMFRKVPTQPTSRPYEIWQPNASASKLTPDSSPGHNQSHPGLQTAPPTPPKVTIDTTAPYSIPVPIHGMDERRTSHQHVFTPFRYLTSKRNRAVSVASLEAQDGTAANTIVGSPTASTYSQAPMQPPPLRDPWLATQEWTNKEEADAKARKLRRKRPGVVFDVGEDLPQEQKRPRRTRTRYRSSSKQTEPTQT